MTHTNLDPGKRYTIVEKKTTIVQPKAIGPFNYVGETSSGSVWFEIEDADIRRFDPDLHTFTPIKELRTLTWWMAIGKDVEKEAFPRQKMRPTRARIEELYPDAIDYMEITWTEKGEEDE